MEYLKKDLLRYAGLLNCLIRGSAQILEMNEHGVFLKDEISGTHMLACDHPEMAVEWIDRHRTENYVRLFLPEKTILEAVEQQLCGAKEEKLMFAYEKTEIPVFDWTIYVQQANAGDAARIEEAKGSFDLRQLQSILERKEAYLAFQEEEYAGWVGLHPEGRILLPQSRNEDGDCAVQMEAWMISAVRQKGLVPYVLVNPEDKKAIALQKALGMKQIASPVYRLILKEDHEG